MRQLAPFLWRCPQMTTTAARCQVLLSSCSPSSASVRLRSFTLQVICSCLPKNLSKACAHSFFVTFASSGRRAILHRGPLLPAGGFVRSARIASPCFPRPKFELGLSSRVPQESAKRVRLSCSIKSRFSQSCVKDVVNVGPSTPHLSSSPFAPMVVMPDFFDDSVVDSSRVVWQLHLSCVEQGFLERFETDR